MRHRTPRRPVPIALRAAVAVACAATALVLAACNQPAYQKDTNETKYNYQYNK